MHRFQRILVCVDVPARDAPMLAYVKAITRLAGTREVHLLHVARPAGAGGHEEADGPRSAAPVDVDALREIAAVHFGKPDGPESLCSVVEGVALVETLRYALDKDIDLLVVGRHYGEADGAVDDALLARRITRKATCTVLVLPEQHRIKAGTILVPVRDSECSANALDVACAVAAATGGAVVALNVYHVQAGYSRIGMTLEEYETAMGAAADRELDRLMDRVDLRGVHVEHVVMADHRGRPVPMILEALQEQGADLVVIGARGRTGAAGVLLGAVTERLIQESPVPVLAVKKKGECLGVLRALLALVTEG
jgi:nucleotide-binding universal stress UspA family protein